MTTITLGPKISEKNVLQTNPKQHNYMKVVENTRNHSFVIPSEFKNWVSRVRYRLGFEL